MNVLLLVLFSMLPGVSTDKNKDQNCPGFAVSFDSQVLANQVTLNVNAKGGVEPYYYFFFDQKNNPITWDFKQRTITVDRDNLPKFIKVLDSNGCSKQIDITESSLK